MIKAIWTKRLPRLLVLSASGIQIVHSLCGSLAERSTHRNDAFVNLKTLHLRFHVFSFVKIWRIYSSGSGGVKLLFLFHNRGKIGRSKGTGTAPLWL